MEGTTLNFDTQEQGVSGSCKLPAILGTLGVKSTLPYLIHVGTRANADPVWLHYRDCLQCSDTSGDPSRSPP